MKTTTININIAGREYPVNVTPETEAGMKKAAALINEQIKTFSSSYAIKDPRDLLAMCALQIAYQQVEKENAEKEKELIEQRIKDIESVLHIVK